MTFPQEMIGDGGEGAWLFLKIAADWGFHIVMNSFFRYIESFTLIVICRRN